MPVRQLLDGGVAVGLGTDSLASNESLNFLDEIQLAEEMLPDLHRTEILWLATVGGSQALEWGDSGIESGQPADLIGFRYRATGEDWWDLPFDPARRHVDFSMVAGEVIFENSDNPGKLR